MRKCPFCAEDVQEDARVCKHCGKNIDEASVNAGPIENYLVWAILTTIFCCPPFGIVSIVYAAQVNGLLAVGNIAAAQKASKDAKTWAWVSFGIGAAVAALYLIYIILILVLASSSN